MPAYNTKIGHAHLKVRDLNRALQFYTRYFSLQITEQVGNHFVFLSGTHMHHELALQALGRGAPSAHPYSVGLYHIAFEVEDKAAFAQAYQLLLADGVEHGAVDHGISWAVYFSDPDGNGLEIYADTRADLAGKTDWNGQSRQLSAQEILAHLPESAR